MQASQFRALPGSRGTLEWLGAVAIASAAIGGFAHRPEVFRITVAALSLSFLILAATFLSGIVYFWRTRGSEPSLALLGLAAAGALGWAGALAMVTAWGWAVLLGNPIWIVVAAGFLCFALSFGSAIYLFHACRTGGVQRADT